MKCSSSRRRSRRTGFDYDQRERIPDAWKAVFDRFFSQFDGSVRIQSMTQARRPKRLLRLEQAVERSDNDRD